MWNKEVLVDWGQQVAITFNLGPNRFRVTSIYARCNSLERLELWDNILDISALNELPWLVGRDFNVISNEEKKLRGLPFTTMEAMDFANCIKSSALVELKFITSCFTWWNGRIQDD